MFLNSPLSSSSVDLFSLSGSDVPAALLESVAFAVVPAELNSHLHPITSIFGLHVFYLL